jgi:putative transposase
LAISSEVRRGWIEWEHPELSVKRQCELLAVARSSVYYQEAGESEYNVALMRLLDEQYTRTPFYGIRRMTEWLHTRGHAANHKRVGRLLRVMGIEAIYPRKRLSQPAPGHQIYPYLLRGVAIERADQVWSTDITYIRLRRGFAYLAAVLDWYSRYVLAWGLSATLETGFCLAALERALGQGAPEIFNTDQGSQFTSADFTGRLKAAGIAISMDGRGRALDNVFVERLWRTVKYEEVYLRDYTDLADAVTKLRRYFRFYNRERLHQALSYRTPEQVYRGAA